MRAGLPVVASNLPGIREQFGDMPEALLVAEGDDAALSRHLSMLAGDSARRATLGRLCRARWRARRSGSAPSPDATWAVYRQALGRRVSEAHAHGACLTLSANKEAARLAGASRATTASRASETIRRASRMLSWAALGLVLFGLNTIAAETLHHAGIVTYVFTRTLLWGIVPYLCTFLLLHRSLHLPPIEGNSLVGISATLPFACCCSFSPAGTIEYSRGALLLGYLTTLVWSGIGYRRFVQNYVPVIGYTDPRALEQLEAILAMPGAAPAGTDPLRFHPLDRGCRVLRRPDARPARAPPTPSARARWRG